VLQFLHRMKNVVDYQDGNQSDLFKSLGHLYFF
jgi:hypothetical protein